MSQKLLLTSVYDEFLLECQVKRYTATTIAFYKTKLGQFVTWCVTNNIVDLESVTSKNVKDYLLSCKDKAAWTQHGHARALQTFFNWCVVDELLHKAPKVVMPKLPKTEPVIFTDDDIKKLLKACETDRNKAIVLCLLDSGVRCAEFVKLNYGDINLKLGEVKVKLGKGQKDRTVFIGAKARKYLLRYFRHFENLNEDSPVWITERTNTRLTVSGLIQILKKIRRQSGVKHCKSHTFRRTFATNCLKNGMNVYHLAALMGHEDVTVLKKYLSVSVKDLQQSHTQYGVVDNLPQ